MNRAAIILFALIGLTLIPRDRQKPTAGTVTARGQGASTPAAAEPLMASARQLFKVIPDTAQALPGNVATPAKIELGKMLFFEPRLAASHSISCNSCHNIGLGGTENEPASIGHHWQRGARNSPTVLNAVFNTAQFWDGGAADLERPCSSSAGLSAASPAPGSPHRWQPNTGCSIASSPGRLSSSPLI